MHIPADNINTGRYYIISRLANSCFYIIAELKGNQLNNNLCIRNI